MDGRRGKKEGRKEEGWKERAALGGSELPLAGCALAWLDDHLWEALPSGFLSGVGGSTKGLCDIYPSLFSPITHPTYFCQINLPKGQFCWCHPPTQKIDWLPIACSIKSAILTSQGFLQLCLKDFYSLFKYNVDISSIKKMITLHRSPIVYPNHVTVVYHCTQL